MLEIILAVAGVLLGGGGVFVYQKTKETNANNTSTKIIADAKKESAEILERANEKALGLIEHTKKEESERRKELQKTENRLAERESSLDRKLDQLDERANKLRQNESELDSLKNEIHEVRDR